MAAPSKFYWYKVQLILAVLLQVLALFAPISYAGNWQLNTTAFLHPLWISKESTDFIARSATTDTVWFYQRPELILLLVWMVALAFLLGWVAFSKVDWDRRVDRLGKAIGGFAAQTLLVYAIGQSATWHVGEASGDASIEVSTQPEFLLLLFPLVLSYLAWRRMKAISVDEDPSP